MTLIEQARAGAGRSRAAWAARAALRVRLGWETDEALRAIVNSYRHRQDEHGVLSDLAAAELWRRSA